MFGRCICFLIFPGVFPYDYLSKKDKDLLWLVVRLLWRHSNQNQIIEIDILVFFEGVLLTCECFVFPVFLKTLPHLFAYMLFLRPQKENCRSLLSLHFDVVGTGDLILYICHLVTHIFISKVLGIKSWGCFYCNRLCDRFLSLLMGGSN